MTDKKDSNLGNIAIFVIVLLIIFMFGAKFILFGNSLPMGRPNIGIDDINGVEGWTGTTITFRIYNSGNAAAENVRTTVEIYPEEGPVLESKSIYIGKINPGESKQMSTKMESSDIKNGSVRIIPS